MNYIFILDGSYTPYENNKNITLDRNLVNGAGTVTAVCINPNGGTFSSGCSSSVTAGEYDVLVLSATCADGSSFNNSKEFKGESITVKIDEDIKVKVKSDSSFSNDQESRVETVLQLHKDTDNTVTVVSDSLNIKKFLIKEGIKVITYKESGIQDEWDCNRWHF